MRFLFSSLFDKKGKKDKTKQRFVITAMILKQPKQYGASFP